MADIKSQIDAPVDPSLALFKNSRACKSEVAKTPEPADLVEV
ncbi:hypothetical protein U8607_12695 [Methylobacterium durans]|nr:hypothetical protein [Methylobacterium durans]MEA1832940.1 hypothetical protein [Methylobacterium durans]